MSKRNRFLVPILAALAVPAYGAPADPAEPLLGFSNERAKEQRELESRFDSHLKASNLREWMKRLSARPHHVGSPYGKENAEFMAQLFRSWGYQTRIEEFKVLLPVPKTRLLEMTAPTRYQAKLAEPGMAEDATSGQTSEQLPIYNAYSIDGDVTGELVFVNYGVPRDYEELERRGIDVKGKIVIARYGGSWRGIKPKVAAERGAVGCLIYSDPEDDGYFQGDVYPKGGWRSEWSAQRGSVMDMPTYPGDPLTPFIGATADAKRLDVKSAPTLTKIPVLPISYGDALPLLRAMGGPLAPEGWRGVLPITYRLGPGPAKVRLKLEFDWTMVPAYDVIAMMPGSERPDQWILRGNHHDAWVNGAMDPISGMVAVMEEARAIGELAKTGWRPKRTL
ncbi:MAG TPA: PA domain-containing protein, partial [Thermoanaerobaculia bacterium]